MEDKYFSNECMSSIQPVERDVRKRVKKKKETKVQWASNLNEIIPHCMFVDLSFDNKLMAVADGGTQLDCMPTYIANELLQRNIIKHISKLTVPIQLSFGKTGVISKLDQYVEGAGLIGIIAVGDDIACPLISEINFTKQGLNVFKTDTNIYVLTKDGKIVVEGVRDIKQSNNELWKFDLELLMKLPSPCLPIENVQNSLLLSNNKSVTCNLARPKYGKMQIVTARKAQRAFGTSYNTIADTVQNGAIRDVPADVTHDLFRKVDEKDDGGSIAYQLSHHKFNRRSGSGVTNYEVGVCFSVDKLGVYKPSTFGATAAYLFTELATDVCIPFAIKEATS